MPLKSTAQEIVNALVMETRRTDPETGVKSGFLETEELINDNGRYYMVVKNCDEDFHDLYSDVIDMDPINVYDFDGDGLSPAIASLLLEYTPGVGITDNTIMNYTFNRELAIDGDYIATSHATPAIAFDNKIYVGDTIQGSIDTRYISVYDKLNDTLLYNISFEHPNWYETALELNDDYLYVGTTFKNDGLVMFGDTLHHLVDDFIQFTTVLQKVNWRTGELLWTRYTGSLEREDTVRDIKVIDDGTLMLEIEVSGPFSYEGVELDPPTYGNGEVNLYNIVFARFTADGDYVNHVHLRCPSHRSFRYGTIESNGDFLATGFAAPDTPIFVDDLEIDVFEHTSTGLVMSFDKDMNMKWHKVYYNLDQHFEEDHCIAIGANKVGNDEVLCAVLLTGHLHVDEEVYSGAYGELDKSQNLIFHYDNQGSLLSEPMPFGMYDRIHNFQKLGEDHYLFFVEYRGSIWIRPDLFGLEFEDPTTPYNMILEVKGDVFESITSINELFSQTDIDIYPSLCQKGQTITVKLPEEVNISSIKVINIFNYNGHLEYTNSIDHMRNVIIPTDNLTVGPKVVTITTDKKTFKQSIIIL